MLFDTQLRDYIDPANMLMYDWLHVFLVDGVFNKTFGLLMRMVNPRIKWTDLDTFIRMWSFPKRARVGKYMDLACPVRAKSSHEKNSLKCSASEGLTVYPVLRKWVIEVVRPNVPHDCQQACDCFLHACRIIDLLRLTQRLNHKVTPVMLHEAIVSTLTLFLRVYGPSYWVPKFHMALHMGMFLKRFGFLLSCFVHERKHKLVKRFADPMGKLQGFDRFVLREVFLAQRSALHGWCENRSAGHVVTPSKRVMEIVQTQFPSAREIKSTSDVNLGVGGLCVKGDVVWLTDGTVAQVWNFFLVDNRLYACVSRWPSIGDSWQVTRDPTFVPIVAVVEPAAYSCAGNVAVVLPILSAQKP